MGLLPALWVPLLMVVLAGCLDDESADPVPLHGIGAGTLRDGRADARFQVPDGVGGMTVEGVFECREGNTLDFTLMGPNGAYGGTLPCREPASTVVIQEVDAPAEGPWHLQIRAHHDLLYSLGVRYCYPAC